MEAEIRVENTQEAKSAADGRSYLFPYLSAGWTEVPFARGLREVSWRGIGASSKEVAF
jgi:hypothetical protein